MIDVSTMELWFATGSQHLYGEQTLKTVAAHADHIAGELAKSTSIPLNVIPKPVLTTPDAITQLCTEANASGKCVGIIAWMHTFSPAKMWMGGLRLLAKPILHLHTQFNRDMPWDSIDMDFMNLNQSAHGDREFGFMATRLGLNRKVVVGHWQDAEVQARIGAWSRAAAAWHDSQRLKIARFGDNMREVAVTEGDKVEAQMRFGYSVNGYGVGDLVVQRERGHRMRKSTGWWRNTMSDTWSPRPAGRRRASRRRCARPRASNWACAPSSRTAASTRFTDTFEDLHGLKQLPGLAVQRLMADGYGFGAEGDWKTAALVRAMKVMAGGLRGRHVLHGGLHLPFRTAGESARRAHAGDLPLDCSGNTELRDSSAVDRRQGRSGAAGVHGCPGPAVNASIVQTGQPLPPDRERSRRGEAGSRSAALPVARAVWLPNPDLATAAAAWIYAGGAHHTGFSQSLTTEHLQDFADMADIEFLCIDKGTQLRLFRNELRWNAAAYR